MQCKDEAFPSPIQMNRSSAETFDFERGLSEQHTRNSQDTSPTISRNARRERTKFTPFQKSKLEECFVRQPHPDYDQRQTLVQMLGLKDSVLQVWFKNRRSKERKKKCHPTSSYPVHMTGWPHYRPPFPMMQQACYSPYSTMNSSSYMSSSLQLSHGLSNNTGYPTTYSYASPTPYQGTYLPSPSQNTTPWSSTGLHSTNHFYSPYLPGAAAGSFPGNDKVTASTPINYSAPTNSLNIPPQLKTTHSPLPSQSPYGQYLGVPSMYSSPNSPFMMSMDKRLSPRLSSPLEYVYDTAGSSKELTNSTPSASGFDLLPTNLSGYYSETCDRSAEAPIFNMSV